MSLFCIMDYVSNWLAELKLFGTGLNQNWSGDAGTKIRGWLMLGAAVYRY